jgi:hypothetical protein
MVIRIIPECEVRNNRSTAKSTVKELVEKVRKRRKYNSK